MPVFQTGRVERIVSEDATLQRLEVSVDGEIASAVLHLRFCARARPGDEVVVNRTASRLGLGSSEGDIVVWNLAHPGHEWMSDGHVMKLRYTPLQTDVLAVEAPESPHHAAMETASSLDGTPVVAASLHSQLLPVVAGIRMRRPAARIAFVMTDGGALDVGLSRTVTRLRELGWLAGTISAGHAFGGDLEAVTVYSALLAAKAVLGADVIVAGMGPGVVGTATAFGTSALELGTTINAAAALRGRPVACVRMSEGDARERHRGLSHHARVALERVALARAEVPVPAGHHPGPVGDHDVLEVDCDGVLDALREAASAGLRCSHMGRGLDDDELFFLAAAAAGLHAAG